MPNIRSLVVSFTVGAAALCVGATASAADIASVVGPAGSAQWIAECPGAQVAPTGASQLSSCAGGGASCMHRVVLDPAEFPEATCSDGTPGVFYVRPGSGGDADRWVVHLQGGSECDDYDSCLERWCGQQGNLPYSANKMSSDWNHDGITDLPAHATGIGMASSNVANEFATWTHVWAYYCSSDSWQGQMSDVSLDDGAGASFDVDANGHTILVAMRRMLRKLNASSGWTAAGNYPVNDIDDATEIVLTGTSAGATGAIANADWFFTTLSGSDNSLVIDANFDVSDSVLVAENVWVDWDGDGIGDQDWYSGRADFYNDQWAPGGFMSEIDAFTDESCRGQYEPLGRMDRCSEFSTMLRLSLGGVPIIETPTFARMDLTDVVISKQYTEHPNKKDFSLLLGGSGGAPTSLADFTRMMRASLFETYDDHDSLTGMFSPRCGDHVGLEAWAQFILQTTVRSTNSNPVAVIIGSAMTFEDTLWEWLDVGSGTRQSIYRIDTATGAPFSGC